MQEREGLRTNAVDSDTLMAELVAFFDADWRFNPPKARRAAAEMIDLLQQRTWIIAPRGPALFGFVHRTFLEYLCAFELAERFKAQTLSLTDLRDRYVLPRVVDDSWHEVLRLLIGQLPVGAADALLKAISPPEREAPEQGPRLGLAWQCLAELAPTKLHEAHEACNALICALYAWLGHHYDIYAP